MGPLTQLFTSLSPILILVCLLLPTTQAGNNETCPTSTFGDITEACTYVTKGPSKNHFRDCEVDIFMTLCGLLDTDTMNWKFVCTSPNYCLGCRYGYGNCVLDQSIDDQSFFLSWYDGMVLGGKYSTCDMDPGKFNATLKGDKCYNDNIDALGQCSLGLINLFKTRVFTCDVMNTCISCFLDLLKDCSSETGAFSVYQRYFRGVVSLTQCDGKIKAVGAGYTSIANLTLILLSFISLITINKVSG